MNNVYENEMRFAPFLKFIDKYKNLLILLAVILLGAVTYFVVNNQLEKKKSEQAALVYKEWLVEISQENPNNENLNNLLDKFLIKFSISFKFIADWSESSLFSGFIITVFDSISSSPTINANVAPFLLALLNLDFKLP